MPVCPQCSANIHAGALYRCPVCGYSITRAERVFGNGTVVFTRVTDAAGALKNDDLQDLMRYLANLERNLPPVALCVYITDLGNERELRPHAHWILNHAGIHHPSFGKREDHKAIEDAGMREDIREKGAPPREVQKTGFLHSVGDFWQSAKERVRNVVRPYAAPVKMEWALILVMDVQQELACFSWGYRLDPYINPERINKAIISARLQFRERATAQGIKKVMRNAVRIIASDSRAVSRRIRKEGRVGKPVGVETMPEIPATQRAMKLLLPAMLGLSLAAASAPVAMAATTQKPAQRTAQKTTQKTAQRTAPKTAPKTAQKTAQKTASQAKSAAKATVKQTARKVSKPAKSDTSTRRSSSKSTTQKPAEETKKVNLAEGPETVRDDKAPLIVPAKLPSAKPAAPHLPDAPVAHGMVNDDIAEEVEDDVPEVDVEDTPPAVKEVHDTSPAAAPRWNPEDYTELMKGSLQTGYTALFPAKGESAAKRAASGSGKAGASEESDTKVLGRYCPEYSKPSPHGLIDPQGLLSTMEREDVEHQLREINRNGKFRVYAAVVKAGQEMPGDLAVGTLATAVAQPCEYAVLLLYYIGAPSSLELGYQEIKADDAQRHAWLNKVRAAAAECGTGTEGLMAALRQTAANISPVANSFRPLTIDNTVKAPKLDIPFKQEEEIKEPGFKEKIAEKIQDPENTALLPYLGGSFLCAILLAAVWLYRRRHSPTLLDTTPDWRLSARYGAGVSRLVKYLEGKESEKEKTLF